MCVVITYAYIAPEKNIYLTQDMVLFWYTRSNNKQKIITDIPMT